MASRSMKPDGFRKLIESMKIRTTPIALLVSILTGCGTYVNLPKSTQAPAASDPTIIVIGAGTASNLFFGQGILVGEDGWSPDTFGADRISGRPEGGYIVRQVAEGKADWRFGLGVLTTGGRTFYIRCGNRTPILHLPRGKVVYIADFELQSPMAATSGLSATRRFEEAREFMRINYPSLVDRLEQGEFEWRVVSSSIPGNCSK